MIPNNNLSLKICCKSIINMTFLLYIYIYIYILLYTYLVVYYIATLKKKKKSSICDYYTEILRKI